MIKAEILFRFLTQCHDMMLYVTLYSFKPVWPNFAAWSQNRERFPVFLHNLGLIPRLEL